MSQKLKKLRFPGVLKIFESIETDHSLIIATERICPLYQVVQELSEDTKLWGLGMVLRTLCHITGNGNCTHGNINLGSILINPSGEWVVGGMEVTTQNDTESVLSSYGSLLGFEYAPPEVQKSGYQRQVGPVDAYQFGLLVYDVFNNNMDGSQPRTSRGKIPSNVLFNLQKQLCHPNPRQRMSLEKAAESSAMMSNPMMDLSNQVDSLSIATDSQMLQFIENLETLQERFPPEYLHYKILPQIVTALTQKLKSNPTAGGGEVGIKCLTCIIQISKGLPSTDYNKTVTPLIVQMFGCQDRAVRLQLILQMPQYIDSLDKKIVSDKIFPLLATGFSDTEPAIREHTVRSLIDVTPKLTDRILNGELLRHLAKAQNDSQASIRANTTILLGRIARHLNPSSRPTVLIAAYSRALKDPYVHSRIAAIQALGASIEYFTPQVTCEKVVGAIAPLLLDSDSQVRKQAKETLDMFLNIVSKHADTLSDKTDIKPEDSKDKWSTGVFNEPERAMSAPVEPKITKTITPSVPNAFNRQPIPSAAFGSMSSQNTIKSPPPFTSDEPVSGTFDKSFDDTIFDDNNNDADAWGDAWDDDDPQTQSATKKINSLDLQPQEDDDDGWGWD
jgi:SCY1-like protein 1